MLNSLSIPVVAGEIAVVLIKNCIFFLLLLAFVWGVKKFNERVRKKSPPAPTPISNFEEPETAKPSHHQDYRPRVGLEFELSVVEDLLKCDCTGVFHDVNIECELGKAQLDVVVVNDYAIYAIECKNWNGRVYGNSNWNRWMKIEGFRPTGRYGADKSVCLNATELYNPIYQNNWHIRVLSRCLGEILGFVPPVCSIVVFCDRADIRNIEVLHGERVITKASLVSVLNDMEAEKAKTEENSLTEYRKQICLFLNNK